MYNSNMKYLALAIGIGKELKHGILEKQCCCGASPFTSYKLFFNRRLHCNVNEN